MRDLVTEWLNQPVSMKSGLRDRNNGSSQSPTAREDQGLNEVRSWRPEQYASILRTSGVLQVSMKSGLRNRNNEAYSQTACRPAKPLVRAHLRKAVNKAQ